VEAYHDSGQLDVVETGLTELLVTVAIAMIAGYIAIKLVSKVVASKIPLLRILQLATQRSADSSYTDGLLTAHVYSSCEF
jgi:hypothetical protein